MRSAALWGGLAMAMAMASVACNHLFGALVPYPATDETLDDCPGVVEMSWFPLVGPGISHAGEGLLTQSQVGFATVVGNTVFAADTRQVYAVDIRTLRASARTDGGLVLRAEDLYVQPGKQGATGVRAVHGLARMPWRGDSGDGALLALSCRWQQGCTLDIAPDQDFRDAGLVRSPTLEGPCGDDSGTSELRGASSYGCFPYAAPILRGAEASFALAGFQLPTGEARACVTQGVGGAEKSAATVACVTGHLDAAGALGGTELPRVEIDLSMIPGVALSFYLDRAATDPQPARVVTTDGLYLVNADTAGSPSASRTRDLLAEMPRRTVTAQSISEQGTWLAVRVTDEASTRSAVWEVLTPSDAEPWPSARSLLLRRRDISALVRSDVTSTFFWIEDGDDGTQARSLHRWDKSKQCAERLRPPMTKLLPYGLGTNGTKATLIVPHRSESGLPDCARAEVFVLADGVLWWGIPASCK